MNAAFTNITYAPQPQPAVNGMNTGWQVQALERIGTTESLEGREGLARNRRITAAYADMYLRDPQLFKWAGMAALTSAAVGRGMYMMLTVKHTGLGMMIGLFNSEVATVCRALVAGNLAVYRDIYWQHLAYDRKGIGEIERLAQAAIVNKQVLQAWRQIDAGRRSGDQAEVWAGNTELLRFEQRDVLQPVVYEQNPALWREVCGWIESPIPGHKLSFEQFAPQESIGSFESRWRWIEQSMMPRWQELSDAQPRSLIRTLEQLKNGWLPIPFAVPAFATH